MCDHWWENETQWHRDWKNCFPEEWQEVVHFAEDGEKHIADVKTPSGLVIEFQHSAIKLEEIASREQFYKHMIWIVDGTRLSTDMRKLTKILDNNAFELEKQFAPEMEKNLPKNWIENTVTVYFDIGHPVYLIGLNPDKGFYKFHRSYLAENFFETIKRHGDDFFTQHSIDLYISSLESKLEKVKTQLDRYVQTKGNRKIIKNTSFTHRLRSDQYLYLIKINGAYEIKLKS